MGLACGVQHCAFGGEAGHAEGGQDVGQQQGFEVELFRVEADVVMGGHVGLPAEGFEIVDLRYKDGPEQSTIVTKDFFIIAKLTVS